MAKRISESCGSDNVGYAVRFERHVTAQTQLKVLTDGMLLREAHSDPLLTEYSLLIIDDCHERSIYTDITLGLLKIIRRRRQADPTLSDLKIVILSVKIGGIPYFGF